MSVSKHILVICQYFYPEAFRINDICCELIKRGHKVTVVTGIPNYPQGKFYNGYGWFKKRRETWNGIEIIRIPLFARGKTSVGMVLNYLSFVVSGFFWKLFAKIDADCVFNFETSPMTQALVSVWYAKKRKIPHYIYVQDLWPENVETVLGIHSKLIIGPINKIVDYIYKNSAKIFVTSESFRENVSARVDDADKVIYLPQYAEELYTPTERADVEEIPSDEKFKIIFTGNIGYAQGLDILPKAAEILKEKGELGIQFVLVGDGRYKEKLTEEIATRGVSEQFVLVDRQPAERIPALLAACDVAFLSFMDSPLFEMTIPAKLQSYMACGIPVVASASGETARIIAEANCGICCPLGDAKALVDALIKMQQSDKLEKMSQNAVAYNKANFNKVELISMLETELCGKVNKYETKKQEV